MNLRETSDITFARICALSHKAQLVEFMHTILLLSECEVHICSDVHGTVVRSMRQSVCSCTTKKLEFLSVVYALIT